MKISLVKWKTQLKKLTRMKEREVEMKIWKKREMTMFKIKLMNSRMRKQKKSGAGGSGGSRL